ncbi:MAG: hypothetical protein AAF394_06890, partial [Planctomycetota bacterium]
LAMDRRSEEAREENAEFVLETLKEIQADIGKVEEAAGDYPSEVISGGAWMAGAEYATHAKALTSHFAEQGWLKHEANASGLWVRATLAVCSHYHHMVGPAMIASADCCWRLGETETAIGMWTGVVLDFAFLLDNCDDIDEEQWSAVESLREACFRLQTSGKDCVDSISLGKIISEADSALSKPSK